MNLSIQRILSKYLKDDEELISVERVQTRTSVTTRMFTMGYSNLSNQNHYIGLTNTRVIIVPLNRLTEKPKEDEIFYVEFNDINIQNDTLLIFPPGKNKPNKYYFVSGIQAVTKLSKDEFLFQLEQIQNSKIGNEYRRSSQFQEPVGDKYSKASFFVLLAILIILFFFVVYPKINNFFSFSLTKVNEFMNPTPTTMVTNEEKELGLKKANEFVKLVEVGNVDAAKKYLDTYSRWNDEFLIYLEENSNSYKENGQTLYFSDLFIKESLDDSMRVIGNCKEEISDNKWKIWQVDIYFRKVSGKWLISFWKWTEIVKVD